MQYSLWITNRQSPCGVYPLPYHSPDTRGILTVAVFTHHVEKWAYLTCITNASLLLFNCHSLNIVSLFLAIGKTKTVPPRFIIYVIYKCFVMLWVLHNADCSVLCMELYGSRSTQHYTVLPQWLFLTPVEITCTVILLVSYLVHVDVNVKITFTISVCQQLCCWLSFKDIAILCTCPKFIERR